MKIAHICLAAFYIDGFGYQENILPRLHSRMGHEVRVIASTENYVNNTERRFVEPGAYVNEDGINVVRLPHRSFIPRPLRGKIRAYEGLRRELDAFKPDLIFVHDGQFFDLFTIRDYARRNNCRVVSDCHTDEINSARGFVSRHILHRIYYRWIARQCDDAIDLYFPTLPIRADFLAKMYGLPRSKMRLLPFGADDTATSHFDRNAVRAEQRARLGIGHEDFVILTGGKLDMRKNIHRLIDRFSRLREAGELANAHLVVFGQPDATVADALKPIAMDANVHMPGWQKADTVFRLFWAADLAFFPGTHSVLWEEAIGHGLGTVILRWPGIDHLDVGGNALTIDSADDASLDSTLRKLAANNWALARSLTDSAAHLGPKHFAYSAIAEKALTLS